MRGESSTTKYSLQVPSENIAEQKQEKHKILVLGTEGVGKTSLIDQFKTSEYCYATSQESGELSYTF